MNRKNLLRVYLAGGFKSRWQERVASDLREGFELLDPSRHGLAHPRDYVEWDLKAIRACDVVLANMEGSNPGGYALALEIGYGKALGKKIVLVESQLDSTRDRYFEMVRQVADARFTNLESAITYLRDGSVRP
jgi:nucleoside 2-deoxyribosyltransferase